MDRASFQKISKIRTREARTLLRSGHYSGAYYLTGYAIECALKACVAKQIKKHDFPDKKLVNDAYTHNLEKLVTIAGLKLDFEKDRNANAALELNWAVVKDWNEETRYELGTTEAQARDMYSACTTLKSGVLRWIRERW